MAHASLQALLLCLVFGTAIAIPVSISWFEHRTKTKALDIIRVYAERNQEPPASVMQALTPHVFRQFPSGPKKPLTRGAHLAHAAGNVGLAAGLGSLAWWRFTMLGEATPLVIVLSLAAIFFAASIAPRLVGAYYARSDEKCE